MLPDGVEPDKMGWSQKDMDFVEQMHWSRDDILSGLRTPHVVLGLGAGENLNRATADTTNYIYALRTVTPRLRRIAASLNAFIVPRFGKDIVFDFDNVVPDDEDLQIRKRIAALGGAPYQSVNEIREDIGLPKVPGGERVMTTYSQIPLGSTPEEPEPKRLAPSGAYFALQFAKKNEDVSESVGKSVDSIVEKAAKTLESVEKVLKRSREEGSWRGFVARVTPYEDLLRKRFARYGRDVAARAESNLSEASKGIDYDELLNEEEEVRSIMRFVHPALEDLYRREGVAVADEISGAFEATEARIRETVGRAVNLLAKSYHEETVRLLREALEEGIVEGEGIDKLKRRIRDVGEFSSDVRALRVARTETFRIANLAGKEAYRQSGFTKLVWFTASDEAVCQFCGPMDGKVVSIEENFFNKGERVCGADGGVLDLDYSDVEAGALHPNCRCRVVGRRADEE
jgi:SPP1 gp7 family putative phage head morphogenesis protein